MNQRRNTTGSSSRRNTAGTDAAVERSLDKPGFFPIGFGVGAVAALALFFGFRAFSPDTDPAPENTAAGAQAVDVASPASGAGEDADAKLDTALQAPESYVAGAADVEAASDPATSPDIETLASLGDEGVVLPIDDDLAGALSRNDDADLPRIDDPDVSELFGGRVVMVSSGLPSVVVLADGRSLAPGEQLPGGHRIVAIKREHILLERDGVESGVIIP